MQVARITYRYRPSILNKSRISQISCFSTRFITKREYNSSLSSSLFAKTKYNNKKEKSLYITKKLLFCSQSKASNYEEYQLDESFPGLQFHPRHEDVNKHLLLDESDGVQNDEIRVRYAPSPTGELHLGGLRTALFNYLFAKKNNGKFFLRIEDTDRTRYRAQSISSLLSHFQKLNIIPDNINDIILQSRRLNVYKHYAHQLVENGYAYYCFCSQDSLQSNRENAKMMGSSTTHYNRHCYYLTQEEVKAKLDAKLPYVIRMKIPHGEKLVIEDIVKGKKFFDLQHIDDQILLKSDGFPTYHLASVVDDHFMNISHVIRGEEWLSSLPKHILLYKYFGWKAPKFAHLPLLFNVDRSKLSKRQKDASVLYYFEQGFDKDVIINYVAQLGWSPIEKQNFIPIPDMISQFSLDRISDSGAMVDLSKLKSLNSHFLRIKCDENIEKFSEEILPIFEKEIGREALLSFPSSYIHSVISLTTSRMSFISDYSKIVYFFRDPILEKMEIEKRFSSELTKNLIQDFITLSKDHQNFPNISFDDWNQITGEVCKQHNVTIGKLYAPLRYLLTGSEVGASVVDTLNLLTAPVSVSRVSKYFDYFAINK